MLLGPPRGSFLSSEACFLLPEAKDSQGIDKLFGLRVYGFLFALVCIVCVHYSMCTWNRREKSLSWQCHTQLHGCHWATSNPVLLLFYLPWILVAVFHYFLPYASHTSCRLQVAWKPVGMEKCLAAPDICLSWYGAVKTACGKSF